MAHKINTLEQFKSAIEAIPADELAIVYNGKWFISRAEDIVPISKTAINAYQREYELWRIREGLFLDNDDQWYDDRDFGFQSMIDFKGNIRVFRSGV